MGCACSRGCRRRGGFLLGPGALACHRVLSQPFFVAQQFTGLEGESMPVADTIRGFKEIVEGKHDQIPEQDFYLVGSIEDASRNSRSGSGIEGQRGLPQRDQMQLQIVSAERSLVNERVDEVEIPGAEGYFGVLPGHTPLLAMLRVGELWYARAGKALPVDRVRVRRSAAGSRHDSRADRRAARRDRHRRAPKRQRSGPKSGWPGRQWTSTPSARGSR